MSITTVVKEGVVGFAADLDSKKDLIKRTICKGATDEELELFMAACRNTGLNPFVKQIYAVKRWSNVEKREVMSMQTSIDGFRLIAERTGNYSPGREPTFTYDEKGKVLCATAYVKKRTADGTWHEVASSAYFDEYVQRGKEEKPTKFWEKMPHVMLAKCAESLALRKAFPMELSAIYTDDEMGQATSAPTDTIVMPPVDITISADEFSAKIDTLLLEIDDREYIQRLVNFFNVPSLYDLPEKDYARALRSIEKKAEECRKKVG